MLLMLCYAVSSKVHCVPEVHVLCPNPQDKQANLQLLNWIKFQTFTKPHSIVQKGKAKANAWSFQSCLTLCNIMDHSPPGFSVHRILQVRILEWVAMPTFRGSSQPRNRTHISYVSCKNPK